MSDKKTYYKAQSKQALFHFSKADEVLYGGAAGGGKSYSILWDAVLKAMKYKNARIGIFRRKFPELEKSIILEFLEHVPNHWYNYNKKEHRAYFKQTGALIEFNHCQLETDVYNYQSAQYDFMYFDELTHFTEYIYTYLNSRCRSPKGYPSQIKSASNPGNIGHHWVKSHFIDGSTHNVLTKRNNPVSGRDFSTCFIPARVYDNSYIMENDPKYVSRLLGIKNESERKALLDGDWDSFDGQYFKEWAYDVHVVAPYKIPDYWTRIRCLDWGYANPTAVLWIAFSPKGEAIVYKELTMTQSTIEQIAAEILSMSGKERIDYTMADPSLWSINQYERGESVAMKMTQLGVQMLKADNNRLAGWNTIHSYLFHEEGKGPRMKIFETCYDLIKSLPGLVHNKRKPEDVDTDGDDHHSDALRYGLMSKPIPNQKPLDRAPHKSFEFWMNKSREDRLEGAYVGRL